jgi:glutathione S-transferase
MKKHLFHSLVLTAIAFGSAFTVLPEKFQSTGLGTLFSAKADDAAAVLAPEQLVRVTRAPLSWEELDALLPKTSQDEPVLTLYRDTNGWCPFCERVWVALRVKKLPFKETLVSLESKPDWYKDLVPSTMVPAVLLHGSAETNERKIIWESIDILKALDDAFPDTPRLMLDTPEFQAAVDMNEDVINAGLQYTYGGRNQTMPDEAKMERQEAFEMSLNKLDAVLKDQGPFRLGAEFTGIDAIMIPTLERWRYQLPVTNEFDILKGRPNFERWFDAMDSFGPYSDRVAGDRYSWTATASMFLRYFGGGEDKPHVAAGIKRADATADDLSRSFAHHPEGGERSFALEAATKLVSNHKAVIKDCTRQDPVSQKHIPRASDVQVADKVLRFVSSILLSSDDDSVIKVAKTCPIVEVSDSSEGALVARTVASRLCVPRDMGAPAAGVLRACLSIVADRLEEENFK